MNILLTGSSGLIGSALRPRLISRGHTVYPLIRAHLEKRAPGQPTWRPDQGRVDLGNIPFDAVTHLAGENIAQRWSASVKERLRQSRVDATRLLCDALLQQPTRPKTLICASATGIYGNRGDELLDETSKPGQGFLADLCQQWEAASKRAADAAIRVVHLRFGIVLSPRGGALKKMLPAFRLGLGGKLGSGEQYWSWIAIDDALAAIEFALGAESLNGAVNIVSPQPLRNVEFTRALARELHRPAFFKVPAAALKLLMGEMADEALLCGFRVRPAKLEQNGFHFRFPDLAVALSQLLR